MNIIQGYLYKIKIILHNYVIIFRATTNNCLCRNTKYRFSSLIYEQKKFQNQINDFGLYNRNKYRIEKKVPTFLFCTHNSEADFVIFDKFHNFLLAAKVRRLCRIPILYILHYFCEQIKPCRKYLSR